MLIYEFRVKINGTIINHSTMPINCYESEHSYVPNDEEDRKKYNVTQPYPKSFLEKPSRNHLFYFIYTTDETRLYDTKTKLLEYISKDYEKQEKELEKEIYKTRAIKDKIWSIN